MFGGFTVYIPAVVVAVVVALVGTVCALCTQQASYRYRRFFYLRRHKKNNSPFRRGAYLERNKTSRPYMAHDLEWRLVIGVIIMIKQAFGILLRSSSRLYTDGVIIIIIVIDTRSI